MSTKLILPPSVTRTERYRGTCGTRYVPPSHRGYTTISCLEFLGGQVWNDTALNFVHALRPSSIRVTNGECTTDAQLWRVTVFMKDGVIERIEQEVEVGLEGGFVSGHDLDCRISKE